MNTLPRSFGLHCAGLAGQAGAAGCAGVDHDAAEVE